MAQVSPLEERAARIEGILEELRSRVSRVETEMSGVRGEMSELRRETRQEMSELRQEMRSNFRWTIGIMLSVLVPMWVSIVLVVVFSS